METEGDFFQLQISHMVISKDFIIDNTAIIQVSLPGIFKYHFSRLEEVL